MDGMVQITYDSKVTGKKEKIFLTEEGTDKILKFKKSADDGDPESLQTNNGFYLSRFLREHEIVTWQALPMLMGVMLVIEFYPKKEDIETLDNSMKDFEQNKEKLIRENEIVREQMQKEKLI